MGFMSGRGPLSRGPSVVSAFSVSVLMTRGKVLRPSPSHKGKAASNLRPIVSLTPAMPDPVPGNHPGNHREEE